MSGQTRIDKTNIRDSERMITNWIDRKRQGICQNIMCSIVPRITNGAWNDQTRGSRIIHALFVRSSLPLLSGTISCDSSPSSILQSQLIVPILRVNWIWQIDQSRDFLWCWFYSSASTSTPHAKYILQSKAQFEVRPILPPNTFQSLSTLTSGWAPAFTPGWYSLYWTSWLRWSLFIDMKALNLSTFLLRLALQIQIWNSTVRIV